MKRTPEHLLLFHPDSLISKTLTGWLADDFWIESVTAHSALANHLNGHPPAVVLSEATTFLDETRALTKRLAWEHPETGVIWLVDRATSGVWRQALHAGARDVLAQPFSRQTLLEAAKAALGSASRASRNSLQSDILSARLRSLETLQDIGRQVTASLDLDRVLTAVVEAAVTLTHAEEGSLLLLDRASGELYMRAARNLEQNFVQTFRLPVQDTLPGEVLCTGEPLILNHSTPVKVKTAYLVHALMYVPLKVRGKIIGVLGVHNRRENRSFDSAQLEQVAALADYAAIALENARLYAVSEVERIKLETLLTNIQDGVLVLDDEEQIVMINPAAQQALGLPNPAPIGQAVRAVIPNDDLLGMLANGNAAQPSRSEVAVNGDRIYSAQSTPIPGVGLVITMQDITYLKELDRIKSDFVSMVSHDLRSPLTAILGYVELIARVGPVSPQQRTFIDRIQVSVHNITALINDLLDLGRIEAGFDVRKEIVPLAPLIRFTVDSFQPRAAEKGQALRVEMPAQLPTVLGNPVRLKQLLANLVSNAIKYTPDGGKVNVIAASENGQVIIRVQDSGLGIPQAEHAFIFDKFYRASNAPSDVPGTGLGLAIVKSIVDNHQGRIWLESTPGEGSTFSVVLPVSE